MTAKAPITIERRRFVWVISVLLLAGFLGTSLIGYLVAHRSLSEQITETALPLTSDNIYSEIQQDLLRPIFISSLMAQDTFLRDWVLEGEKDPDAMIRYLAQIQERYATVTSFFVSERTRRYYHPSGVLKTVSGDDPADAWYFRSRSLVAEQPYEINIDTDTADPNTTNVFVNYQVFDYQGEVIGVGGVGLAARGVKELIEQYQQRYGRRVYFIDRAGRIQLEHNARELPRSIRDRPGLAVLATQILTSPGGSYEFREQGRTVYLNSRMLPEFGWYLMVEQDEDSSQQGLLHTLFANLLLSLLVTAGVLFLAHITLGRYQQRLENMATTDTLTGAMSRQVFDTLLQKTLEDAQRTGDPTSLVMFDLDHFKQINDRHGHLAGDRVLWNVSQLVHSLVRESDSLCRWGGEEFMLLLPHCSEAEAFEIAEELRVALERNEVLFAARPLRVTASFGVVEHDPAETPLALVHHADQALYQAKRDGRNRVSKLKHTGDEYLRPASMVNP